MPEISTGMIVAATGLSFFGGIFSIMVLTRFFGLGGLRIEKIVEYFERETRSIWKRLLGIGGKSEEKKENVAKKLIFLARSLYSMLPYTDISADYLRDVSEEKRKVVTSGTASLRQYIIGGITELYGYLHSGKKELLTKAKYGLEKAIDLLDYLKSSEVVRYTGNLRFKIYDIYGKIGGRLKYVVKEI